MGAARKASRIMVFDLLAAVGLTVGSAIIVAALASHYPDGPAARTGAAAVLVGWLRLIVVLGATGALDFQRGLGAPGVSAATDAVTAPTLQSLGGGERLPLLIAPVVASALLAIAVALAIFKPGWRLRSPGTAGADASPRHASSPDSWPIVRLVARCT